MSHPVRGAWIEIRRFGAINIALKSHPVRGAWIEIHEDIFKLLFFRRTPSGVRGLKCRRLVYHEPPVPVAPRQGCVD